MPAFSTPDVYVREIKVFPPSVAEVESAIPAFIGYTEKATRDAADDLVLTPTTIFSLTEFEQYYGGPKVQQVDIAVTTQSDTSKLAQVTGTPALDYLLYHSMKLFFDNGGGKCYVVSVGTYKGAAPFLVASELTAGLAAVASEDEPTLLVIPEAVKLTYAEYSALSSAMLLQCFTLGDRFAILDAFAGTQKEDSNVDVGGSNKRLDVANRDAWTGDIDRLKYGAAYYPFLRTTLNPVVPLAETNVMVALDGAAAVTLASLKATQTEVYNAAKAAVAKSLPGPAAERRGGRGLRVHRHQPRRVEGAGQRAAGRRARAGGEARHRAPGPAQRRPDHRQVDQRDARLRRQGHAGVGRAHARGERQRVALRPGAALLQHGRGVGEEVDLLGGVRDQRRQYVGQGARHDRELPHAEVARRRARRRAAARTRSSCAAAWA